MSRIGRMPIPVPEKVTVAINGRRVTAEGPKGKLELDVPVPSEARLEDSQVIVDAQGTNARSRAMHGLSRSLIANMVQGVHEGFVKKLEIHGVGFKGAVQGRVLELNLGYSHTIKHPIPDQVEVKVEANTNITIEGPDKQKVGQMASEVRGYYPVEPYKGKGVRYAGEDYIRKVGKQVQ
ncbi:MAG: 50S ribosomal protein L6 [Verrucomicrobiota bacterium]|nr:50S ribosomal protein L6 [Verrucomicrobiota bacterium]